MLVRARAELIGAEVLAADGPLGKLEDLYFDLDWWEAWYLVVDAGPRVLVPVGFVEGAAPARRCLTLALTRAQLRPHAWPLEHADWLAELHVCSVRAATGWSIVADDGPAGAVADFLVELSTRSIAYVVASLDQPIGLQRVLIPLDWLETGEALDTPLRVRRSRAELSSAPGLGVLSLLPAREKG